MSGVPYVFGNATTSIPLSQLDVNFATNATIGTTSVGLGNTTTTLVGLTNVSTTVVNTSNVSANTSLLLQTNGTTTAITVDTSQNVGVGGTPSAKLDVVANNFAGGPAISARYNTSNARIGFNIANSNGFPYIGYNTNNVSSSDTSTYDLSQAAAQLRMDNGQFRFNIAASGTAGNAITFTQAMTLDTSGNLLVGQTSLSTSNVGVSITGSGYTLGTGFINATVASSTSAASNLNIYSTGAGAYRFYVDMGGTVHATSTSISAISDQTLKTNIKDLETGLTEVLALKPRRFDWLNGDGTNVAGFISQEVQTVLPDLVNSAKYSIDENGETVNKLFLKMGDMIPTMVKAIQELSAQVTTLQTQVTALKAKVGI